MSDISREETDAKIEASAAEYRAQSARTDCRLDVAVGQLQGELRHTAVELKAEMHRTTSILIKWMVGFSVTMVLMNLGVTTFMWNSLKDRPALPAPTVQPPIIITIPGPAPVR